MFYGLLNLPWWGMVLVTLVLTHITIISVTLYLHRCQAHRSLEIHPAVSHFFRFWLWITTGMTTKVWAAIHRKHHARVETENDPHSPQIFGIKTLLFKGTELYKREAKNQETLERFGQGTPDDWMERNVYVPFHKRGILLTLVCDLLLFGVPGLTMWAVQMMWIPFFATAIINGVGHYWGYRNFESEDASRNVVPWGTILGGEELHNNHHTYPTSAKMSVKWWEFDSGWFYICLLSFFGLARAKRVPPTPVILKDKTQIDAETLCALIANRIQVMTTFSKQVIKPLLKSENRAALQLVTQFRAQLQAIWNKTTASQKELIEALHEWCEQAEKTGVKRLQEFVAYLKGYSLQTALS